MNAFGGKTGFRGFANKLRDQAKDVVGNVKLPSLDEMAKNDEYIHSPDFKVRGARTTVREDQSADISTTGGTTLDEASNYSTESSWSLLDRSSRSAAGLVAGGKTPTIPQQKVPEPTIQATIPSENDRPPTITKPAGSLLSVVSDALQPTTPVQQNRTLALYDDDSESSQDFDEEDPILFSIRKDQTNSKNVTKNSPITSDAAPATVITIQKSSNRFLDDVRLQSSVEQDDGFDGIIRKAQDTQTENANTPRGGFFNKNSAIQNFQRMVLRIGPQQQQQQRTPPPLSRGRPSKAQPNDDFQIEASTSVGILGDDELERLKQLKLAGESSSAFASVPRMMEYLGEHKHFLFVVFTMLLCIFVYFRKSAIAR